MCYWEGPPPAFLQETYIKKARKEHRCDECNEKIKPNLPYKRIVGSWDGVFQQINQCQLCYRVWDDLVEADFCPDYGGLWEFIWSEFEEANENCD